MVIDMPQVVGVSSVEYIDVHVPFCNQSHELVTDAIQEPRPRTGQLFVNMLKKLNAQVRYPAGVWPRLQQHICFMVMRDLLPA